MNFRNIAVYTACMLLISMGLASCKSDENISVGFDKNDNMLFEEPSYTETGSEERLIAYALSENITETDAELRLAVMDNAYKSTPKIEEYFRNSMTGTYFSFEDGEFGLNIRTTNKQDVLSLLDQQLIQTIKDEDGLPIRILFNSPHNVESINNILETEVPTLLSGLSEVQGFGYNPIKDTIVINVFEPNEERKSEWLNKQNLNIISGLSTEIIFVSKPITVAGIIGGAHLDAFGSGQCTAGYPATRNGSPGIITAAHCGIEGRELGTKAKYIGRNKANTYSMTLTGYDNGYSGRYHDLAFFESDDKTIKAYPAYFASSSSNVTRTYPAATAHIGTFLCHYGRNTGTSCGNVSSISHRNPNTPGNKGCASLQPCANSFIEIKGANLKCNRGDSGGPVYGSVPYGIASTCLINSIGNATLYYSQLKYAANINAIPVVTQN